MRLTPYIFFPGTAEEALHFYENVFGGTISELKRYEGSPAENLSNDKRKLMHARVSFGESMVMVCDATPDKMPPSGSNIQLSVEFAEVNDMNEKFKKLAEGGKITMELQDAFWGARFGMLTDKYGINWMFNCQLEQAHGLSSDEPGKTLDITD